MASGKIGRNEPCPCGTGKKFKACCGRVESGSSLTPPALFQSARNALAAGEFDTALELAQRAARGDPEDPSYPTLLGLIYTGLGQLGHALAAYEQALLIDPNFSHAHYHQAAIYAHQGRFEQAIHCFRRALATEPTHAPALEGLADAMATQGHRDEAIDCYRQALSIRDDFFETHLRLAALLQGAGKYDEAIESAKRALALNPQCTPASLLIGGVLTARGQAVEAIEYFQRALTVEPGSFKGHFNLGSALHRLGRYSEARISFQRAVDLEPGDAVARYMLAAVSGASSDSAPSKYVELLFDGYAGAFQSHMTEALEYNVPERLVTLLAQPRAPGQQQWDVLDLGCGTGLVGAQVAPYARALVGVDLSAKMLEIAGDSGRYSRLVHADLLTMMRSEPAASFDVVIAADVFIYTGRLEPIITEIRRVLRPGGIAAFSFEALEGPGTEEPGAEGEGEFRLNPTGRYSHSSRYLRRLAQTDSFSIEQLIRKPVRRERGQPVDSWMTVWTNTR